MNALIVGGTGTLGRELVEQLLAKKAEVAVFSRDELKQKRLKEDFPAVSCILGDIRDPKAIRQAVCGRDVVFHVAALKHVDILEENPIEAVKTNVLGTVNVADACIKARVKNVVFCSTDKAVLPINTYGHSKAMSEKILFNFNAAQKLTRFAVFRWGNVIGSRGSVIPVFAQALKKGVVSITDERMTRFWLPAADAARYMITQYKTAPHDRACIPPMKAASVVRVVKVMSEILGVKNFDVAWTGLRAGEKIHECVESSHDKCIRSDTAEQYTDAELETLLRVFMWKEGLIG